jgi:hypothetical protein
MTRHLGIAVAPVLAVAAAVGGQTPQATPTATPSNLLVDVSVVPVADVPLVLVPGDRTDKPAYLAEVSVVGPTERPVAYAHKQLVVFAGEETNGSFKGADLSVGYRIRVDPEKRTADASVRVSRDGRFLCGSRTRIKITVPEAGIKPAPGK